MKLPVPYELYELAVQSPDSHVELFSWIYQEIHERPARRLREDFCGTFQICCEWAKADRRNTSVGIDLDPDPICYGKETHWEKLSEDQQKRVEVKRGDVLTTRSAPADIVVACNFSYYIFKERKLLVRYFKSVLKALKSGGILILETGGGPGFIEKTKERKTVRRRGKPPYVYTWDQQSFDPVTHSARYAIHFRVKGQKAINNAFTYDWRIWSIPEVKECLLEAGFARSLVYWETEHRGRPTGEYAATEAGDNAYSWCSYLVGVKR